MEFYAVLICLASILLTVLQQYADEIDLNYLTARIFGTKMQRLEATRHPRKLVDCKALQTQLFRLIKNRDVDQVQDYYRIFLSNCFENDKIQQNRMKIYFEKFLDFYLPEEERARERETSQNTRINRHADEIVTEIVEDPSVIADEKRHTSSPISVNVRLSPEQISRKSIKKTVKLNLKPEIQYFDDSVDFVDEEPCELSEIFIASDSEIVFDTYT